MKPHAWLFAAAMLAPCLALAQSTPQSTVTETTDPAKIAEVERHAQELASRSQGATSTTATMDERAGMKPREKRRHPTRAKHKAAAKPKAPTETPMATESK